MAITTLKILGLETGTNTFAAQPGSLAVADNVVFLAPNLLGPRRGFDTIESFSFGSSSSRANAISIFDDYAFVHHDTDDITKIPIVSGGSSTDMSATAGIVDSEAGRPKFMLSASNLYINTSTGAQVISDASESWIDAGVRRPLGIRALPTTLSGGTWQTYDTAVAYRAILFRRDANGNVVTSAPCGRTVLRHQVRALAGSAVRSGNVTTFTSPTPDEPHGLRVGDSVTIVASGADASFAGIVTVATVPSDWTFTFAQVAANLTSTTEITASFGRGGSLRIYIPTGITTSHWLQVYRSENTSSATATPSDELFLTYERQVTSGEVSQGYIDVTDITPESFLGEPLYTNPNSGEGDLQANFEPPVCLDMCEWDSRCWYANAYSDRHRLFIDLIGIGSPSGLQANDTFAVGGRTYTAKASPSGATEFQLYTGGSASQNIERTAQDLVKVINTDASQSTVYVYYASADSDIPGKLILERRTKADSSFAATVSRTSAWNPNSSALTSTNDVKTSRVFYSKPGQPEHVPLLSYLDVGTSSAPIVRVIPVRDSLVVFKSDGIWTISGAFPYVVQKIAESKLVFPDTACFLADKAWGWTDQGIVSVSGSGVQVISLQIEDRLLPHLIQPLKARTQAEGFSLPYESARSLIVFCPESGDDSSSTQAYVYNIRVGQWTRWDLSAKCGLISQAKDWAYLCAGDANCLLVERKAFDVSDYADDRFTATLDSYAGTTLSLSSIGGTVESGDLVAQTIGSEVVYSTVESVSGTDITVRSELIWDAPGSLSVYKAIQITVKFNPFHGGDPATKKHFQQAHLLFKDVELQEANVSLSTDIDPEENEVGLEFEGWGDAPWIEGSWGSPEELDRIQRIYPLPRNVRSGNFLDVEFATTEAWAQWSLQGFAVDVTDASEVTKT